MKFIFFVLLAFTTITLTGCGQEKTNTDYMTISLVSPKQKMRTKAAYVMTTKATEPNKVTVQMVGCGVSVSSREVETFSEINNDRNCAVMDHDNWICKDFVMVNGNLTFTQKYKKKLAEGSGILKSNGGSIDVGIHSIGMFYIGVAREYGIINAAKLFYKTF